MIATHHYKAGEIILKESDPGETAYLIKQGRVRVSRKVGGKTIHVCDIEAGNIFGEMSMIDDKPRSATVTAIEDTVVKEIHRDWFFWGLKTDQEFAVKILKILLERLRKASVTISQMKASEAVDNSTYRYACKIDTFVILEGLTSKAVESLPQNPFRIEKFPFLIGRKSKDPLAYNDLVIQDKSPYRISRHHIELDKNQDKIFALDRGSHLGSIVGGQKLGGQRGSTGPIFLQKSETTLILGDKHSPYKYKVIIPF